MLIANKDAISWERADKAGHIGLSAGRHQKVWYRCHSALADRYDLTVTEHGHIRETVLAAIDFDAIPQRGQHGGLHGS